jgi:predicted acetyltransferase
VEGFADSYDADVAAAQEGVWEPARSLVAVDGDQIVGHAAALTYDLSIPGAAIPCAHVTMVVVNPTHRRQGLLSGMMRRQLNEVPEPIAALWASEGTIYQRFGYGLASHRVGLDIDMAQVRFNTPPPAGGLKTLPSEQARPLVVDVYERVWADRPGYSSRPGRRWDFILADPVKRRGGSGPLKVTVYFDQSGAAAGYAMWRCKPEWGGAGPAGHLWIREVTAVDAEAYAKLWHFLLSMDLMRHANYIFGATDEPLLYMVNEPRRMQPAMQDALWVRIVDLPAALTARRYANSFDLVFDVTDSVVERNAGRWRLSVKGEIAECERTSDPADLKLDIADLGALFLGGTALASLVRAGRVSELRPGVVDAVGTGFGWYRAPQAVEIF